MPETNVSPTHTALIDLGYTDYILLARKSKAAELFLHHIEDQETATGYAETLQILVNQLKKWTQV